MLTETDSLKEFNGKTIEEIVVNIEEEIDVEETEKTMKQIENVEEEELSWRIKQC